MYSCFRPTVKTFTIMKRHRRSRKIRDDWIANEYDGKSEITPNDPANWNQEGMAGERPMYVEAFQAAESFLFHSRQAQELQAHILPQLTRNRGS